MLHCFPDAVGGVGLAVMHGHVQFYEEPINLHVDREDKNTVEELSFIVVSISSTVLGTRVNNSTPSHTTTTVSSTFTCTQTNHTPAMYIHMYAFEDRCNAKVDTDCTYSTKFTKSFKHFLTKERRQ